MHLKQASKLYAQAERSKAVKAGREAETVERGSFFANTCADVLLSLHILCFLLTWLMYTDVNQIGMNAACGMLMFQGGVLMTSIRRDTPPIRSL